MEQQGSRLQYYKNRRSSSSDEELKSKLQEFGQSVRTTSQRADQLLQNSQYPQSSLYAQPTSLPPQQYSQIQPQQSQIPQKYQQSQIQPQSQIHQKYQQSQLQSQPQPYQYQTQVVQQPQLQIQQTYQPMVVQQPYAQQQPVYQSVQQYQPKDHYSYISGQEKGQSIEEKYLEYVPYDRTEIEYIPVQKIEYVPQEKKIREYQVVERIVQKVPIKTYETTIEYVPVERVEEHVEYQTNERTLVKEKIPYEQYQKVQIINSFNTFKMQTGGQQYAVQQSQAQYIQQQPKIGMQQPIQNYNPIAISQSQGQQSQRGPQGQYMS